MKITISGLLDAKGREVWSVSPNSSAYEALVLMADKGIGALVVVEGGKPVGIFSERDYARKVILKGKSSRETSVTNISECMTLMTEMRIRHLPVVDNDKLVGIVSIGDVVKTIISEQESVIRELEGYVDDALKRKS